MRASPVFCAAFSLAALFAARWAPAALLDHDLNGVREGRRRTRQQPLVAPQNPPIELPRREPDPPARRFEPVTPAPVRRAEREEAPRRAKIRAHESRSSPVIDASVRLNMQRREKEESAPHTQYWHDDGATRYCHYYDGYWHWYGFYYGPRFYWNYYYMNWWWWWDAGHARWVYWWDGYWWWPGPAGMFVYVDGSYYPYAPLPVYDVPAPPPGTPGTMIKSPDGTRLVQVTPDGDAFLYKERLVRDPKFVRKLAAEVKKARFMGGQEGAPLRIALERKDGSLALFDADGKAAAPAKDATPPKETPKEIPPPPEYAP